MMAQRLGHYVIERQPEDGFAYRVETMPLMTADGGHVVLRISDPNEPHRYVVARMIVGDAVKIARGLIVSAETIQCPDARLPERP